jgi:phosphatidylserine decarboxylase
MKIAKEGFPFIFPILTLACLFFALGLWFLVGLSLVIASCFGFFFRDPKRRVPQDENSILSPADGKIVKIQTIPSHPSFPSSVRTISVFLSLLDVHITRSPVSGYIDGIEYHPGKFFAANNDKASLENESNSIFLKGDRVNIFIKQIVGVLARRIKCFVKRGERVTCGQKMGLMYFGSRVDLFIPGEVQMKVQLNQKVRAGETVIAELE